MFLLEPCHSSKGCAKGEVYTLREGGEEAGQA
mgnify:CR=1 FL=1|jgi:hypothetical protein